MGRPGGRRLVFFAYYYPPLGGAGSLRALSFARHLPALGWDVTVVTPKEGVYGRDPSLAGEGLPGVEVIRTGTWEPAVLLKGLRGGDRGAGAGAGGAFVEEAALGGVGGAVRTAVRKTLYFPDSSRGWIRPAVAAARKAHRARPFDLVLSSSPPVSAHLAAQRFAEGAGVPLVLDFRDLWGPAVEGTPRRARDLHGALLEAAARVVTVSDGYAAWLGASARDRSPAVVTNGFEPIPVRSGERGTPKGKRTLLHAGSTYAARQDFAALARVLEESGAGSGLRLVLRGHADPATRAALAPFAARGTVEIVPFGTHAETLEALARADAILVWAWGGTDAIARGHLPAKLFEAFAAGRPVALLAEKGSEASVIGQRAGLRARDPGDRTGVADLLLALSRGEEPTGTRPDDAGTAPFTRARQARALAAVLDEVAGASR